MNALSLEVPEAVIDAIAERVAERLAARQPRENGDGWLRGADAIAGYIGAPRSRIYALASSGRMECVQRDGSALIAKRSELDRWLEDGGGKRP